MIISHKYKFIFIKTLKTAGTSIEIYLSQLCSDHDVVTPIFPYVAPHIARNYKGLWNPIPDLTDIYSKGIHREIRDFIKLKKFYNHISARRLQNRIPLNIWNEYFKFCVERNPWDKSISHYHMINDRAGGNISFDQYLDSGQYCLNYPKYTDIEGNLIVDRVIKFESLIDDLAEIFEKLKVPFNGTLGVKAKSEHRVENSAYQNVINKQQRTLIADIFSKEIDMHGYTFAVSES